MGTNPNELDFTNLLNEAPAEVKDSLEYFTRDTDTTSVELLQSAFSDIQSNRFEYTEEEKTAGTPAFWQAIEGRSDEIAAGYHSNWWD